MSKSSAHARVAARRRRGPLQPRSRQAAVPSIMPVSRCASVTTVRAASAARSHRTSGRHDCRLGGGGGGTGLRGRVARLSRRGVALRARLLFVPYARLPPCDRAAGWSAAGCEVVNAAVVGHVQPGPPRVPKAKALSTQRTPRQLCVQPFQECVLIITRPPLRRRRQRRRRRRPRGRARARAERARPGRGAQTRRARPRARRRV